MAQSFGVVEEKLYEARFFLEKLRESDSISTDARYYFSAFVSASRSVTFALQATMSDLPDFRSWYTSAQAQLESDPLACHFKAIRNDLIHKGRNPLNEVTVEYLREDLASQLGGQCTNVIVLPDLQSNNGTILTDAVRASETYFESLLRVVYECYDRFRCFVDPRWYFTQDNFLAMGKTFDDAVCELGYPLACASAAPEGEGKWRVLRSLQPPCLLNELFGEFLGLWIADPDDTHRGQL